MCIRDRLVTADNYSDEKFDRRFDVQNSNFNVKFDEQNNKFDKLSNDFDRKFNEQKNCFDDKLNEMNVKLIQQLDKLGRNIENKVSNNVSHDDVNKSEILLNKINGDMLSNSCSDNESRKLIDVSNEVVISTDEVEKEWRDSLNAVSYTHLDVYKRQM